MKYFIAALFSILLIGNLTSQTLNKEIQPEGRKPFLLGKIDKEGLTSKNYNSWFSKNLNAYKVDKETIKQLSKKLKDYKILAFMGTWCGDSKRQIPKLYKVLEASNFPMKQLNMIAVSYQPDLYKQSPNHEEAGLNIHRVPTIIIYKNGKEVNRIVEEPKVSIEKDILNIISTNSYESNYYIVDLVHKIIETKGVKGLSNQKSSIAKQFKGKVSSIYELNTYSKVLISTNQTKKAIAVLKLNTLLFPENPRTYERFIKVLLDNNYNKKARKALTKALKVFPDNKRLMDLSLKLKSL